MSSATVSHPDVVTDALIARLEGDSELMSIELTVLNDEGELAQQPLQGVHYMNLPQDPAVGFESYPAIIVNQPVPHDLDFNKKPSAPNEIPMADFIQTVRVAGRDVDPRNSQFREMRRVAAESLAGFSTGIVDGWLVSFRFWEWMLDDKQDKGGYIYTEIGFKLLGNVTQV